MGRLLGIIMILAGCAGCLLWWMENEKKRQAIMEECIRLFARWKYSLEREHIRLYDFLEQYEPRQTELGEILLEVKKMLRENCYPSGQMVWDKVLKEKSRILSLQGEAYVVLREAGDAFFGSSSAESLRCICVCMERMEKCLADVRSEFAKKRRVYMPVGMLGGVILVILLI